MDKGYGSGSGIFPDPDLGDPTLDVRTCLKLVFAIYVQFQFGSNVPNPPGYPELQTGKEGGGRVHFYVYNIFIC